MESPQEEKLSKQKKEVLKKLGEEAAPVRVHKLSWELAEGSPDAILLINLDSREIIDANKEAENLFGMSLEKIVGKDLSEFRPEEEADQYRELFGEKETEPADKKIVELHIIDSEDNEIPVEIGTSTLELGGKKLSYGVFRDITKRKEAEEREDFLHSLLRHDLKNKSMIIQNYHELLRDFDLPQEAEKYLSQAAKEAEESMKIIEKVKTLREAQKEKIKNVRIDSVLRETVEQVEERAENKGINIEVDFLGEEIEVKGGSLLTQIFSNIIGNSIQHSEGSIIRIRGETTEEEVICIIEDDGKGIPDGEKEHIFNKGYTTDDERGSGLGMFLVKILLDIYGGSIEVKDSNLGGARFDIRFKQA